MLKLVPFNSAWINHDKIDIHAIYRRPRFLRDEYDELQREYDKDGQPTWDYTGPLPIKQHVNWTRKGFEYVTLADRGSLQIAARHGTIEGDWRQYDQHQTGGPWHWRKYHQGAQVTQDQNLTDLAADVNQFGSAAVEAIRRRTDPQFQLPPNLRGLAPGGGPIAADTPDTTYMPGKYAKKVPA